MSAFFLVINGGGGGVVSDEEKKEKLNEQHNQATADQQEDQEVHEEEQQDEAAAVSELDASSNDLPSKRTTFKIVGSILLTIFLLGSGVVLGLVLFVLNAISPVEASDDSVIIEIVPGMNSAAIAQILEDEGLIRNEYIFRYYVRYQGQGGRFQAGTYEMYPGIELDDIIDKLNSGDVIPEETLRFTIPEGMTMIQIADRLSDAGVIDREIFLDLLEDPSLFNFEVVNHIPDNPQLKHQLEGYLFPETYEMKLDSTEHDIIERMLAELEERLDRLPEDWQEQMDRLGLNFHEIMTLASLIEREVVVEAERALVAGVIYNRLNSGMRLQIDATVQYALDEHRERLFFVDLEVDSPYNTYLINGLPPGPIAAPSLSAIYGALFPEETPYFFYVTKKDGTQEHYFAETNAGHESNIARSNENASAREQ